jgi:hypothetical protein
MLPREIERRSTNRARLEPLFCQKYVDGVPHLVEVLDLSPNGLLLRTPRAHGQPECFSIALDVPGNPTTLWLWARTVRRSFLRSGTSEEAVELLGTELFDRASLSQLVRWRAA